MYFVIILIVKQCRCCAWGVSIIDTIVLAFLYSNYYLYHNNRNYRN